MAMESILSGGLLISDMQIRVGVKMTNIIVFIETFRICNLVIKTFFVNFVSKNVKIVIIFIY